MKNVLEILKDLEIEVPKEKETELNKAIAENYKTVAEVEKKVSKLEAEIEKANERACDAENTLKGFDGKDFEAITKERDEWKVKYETKIREDAEAKEKAELDEAIANAIKEAKGRNAKAIISNLDMDAIKASKNRDKDIADAIKTLSESSETAFLFETDPENNRAQFTQPVAKATTTPNTVTMDDIMKMKDPVEAVNMIAKHNL